MAHTWQVGLRRRIDTALPTPLYMQIIQTVIHHAVPGRQSPRSLAASPFMGCSLGL